MEAHPPRPRVFRLEPILHDPGPHAPGGSKFGHLFKKIQMGVKEERESWCKLIHVKTPFQGFFRIGDAVCQGKSQFLHGRRSGFPNMVPADADGIPFRHLAGSKFHRIRYDTDGRFRWTHKCFLGRELFQHVVLNGPTQNFSVNAALFRHGDIHGPYDGRGRINGHGGGDLIDGKPRKQILHVFEGVDGHTAFTALTPGLVGIRVVTHQGGHIKGG